MSGELGKDSFPLREPEGALNDFINSALDLTRKGKFQQVVAALRSPSMAKSLGIDWHQVQAVFLTRPIKPQNVEAIYTMMADKSGFKRGFGDIRPFLTLSELVIAEEVKRKFDGKTLRRLQQDNALLYLEEWLHIWQWKYNRSLTGNTDTEADVVSFLTKEKIFLTPEFIERHGGKKALKKGKEPRGSLAFKPA